MLFVKLKNKIINKYLGFHQGLRALYIFENFHGLTLKYIIYGLIPKYKNV